MHARRSGYAAWDGYGGLWSRDAAAFRPAREGERHVCRPDLLILAATADDPGALLEIRTWRLESLRILRLLGELDAFTALRVRARLDEVVLARRELRLIVDLTQLTFIASTGVGLLLEIREQVGERGGRLIVILAPKSRLPASFQADPYDGSLRSRGEPERGGTRPAAGGARPGTAGRDR
ncbi:STAS domain-containing protein [Streptosporangium sp. NBC_01755]|uniref:STAS domain-containing protein n=1 Tax=unclassified Streptosporangium TaxID=2632669 RepID=UPI002DD7EF83|nr:MULTISPECIES: STAS domain-containing protein [unclassified Streptosporangium]WSA28604.1 STAS domain-containing protein [Streptosporangium sp. NBC_01810]WSC99935.1 STAS domain-containing protein [Streptosporangium sp. NBC_01755]